MVDQLTDNYNKLLVINEKQEKEVLALEVKAILLVIGYVFYQGIIFICISQPSSLRCDNWWLPFSLPLLTATIFFAKFQSTIKEYLRLGRQLDLNLSKKEDLHRLICNARSHVVDIESREVHPSGLTQQLLEQDPVKLFRRETHVLLVSVALLAFTGVILAASRYIPCGNNF